ncbi:MAG TPA: hypothetical protein VGX52_05235, partial [Burkholderiales bacterium]|nr:hypothetical protein [Burkholderiales bacterium]
MGRRRKPENALYPAGVYASRGWFFWKDPKTGAWVKLGKEWDKAARERWVELSTGTGAEGSVAAMLDAHMAYREQLLRERKLAARTYEDNLEYLKPLKAAFGTMPAHALNGRHCTSYLQKRTWQPPARRGPNGE